MELTNHDKNIITIINSNNIEDICEYYFNCRCNINIFSKENTNLFSKNAIYLSFFRGYHYYYYMCDYIKAKKLMKYNNPFIFLFNWLGFIYIKLKKYNKAIYYLKTLKCANRVNYFAMNRLSSIYYILNKKYKSFYYDLKVRYKYYIQEKKYFIFFLINKK